MKQIIVTGGSGLIGQRLQALLQNEVRFVDFSLQTEVDILNKQQLAEKFEEVGRSELVIHLAAFTNVTEAEKQKDDIEGLCYQINVLGTQNIVEICKQVNLPLIFISTDYVFDGTKKELYTEYDHLNPLNWYGKTKVEGEQLVQQLDFWSIFRIGYPYGFAFSDKKDWLHSFVDRMKDDSSATFFEDQIITPLFIDDLVLAIKAYLGNPTAGIWHVFGNEMLSPYELACQVNEMFKLGAGPQPQTLTNYFKIHPEKQNAYPVRLQMSNQRFKALYDWNPQSLDDALALIAQSEYAPPQN